jgi:hypothetical protein
MAKYVGRNGNKRKNEKAESLVLEAALAVLTKLSAFPFIPLLKQDSS